MLVFFRLNKYIFVSLVPCQDWELKTFNMQSVIQHRRSQKAPFSIVSSIAKKMFLGFQMSAL